MNKKKILVIDDNKNWLHTIKLLLEREYDLTLLTDGSQAARFLREKPYDLVIIDFSLPESSGLEVLQKLREVKSDVRAIILTSHPDPDRAMSLANRGFDQISKASVNLSTELMDLTRKALEGKKLASENEQSESERNRADNQTTPDSTSETAAEIIGALVIGKATVKLKSNSTDETVVGVEQKIKALFQMAKEENFEEGIESEFSNGLVSIINKYGAQVINILSHLILSKGVNEEIASEALRWLGRLDHSESYYERLWLLEEALINPSARIRDAASVGLATLGDPHATPYLEQAIQKETCAELREDMQQILESLESAR
ncbi:MAG: response regulator [Blastocatellia bacterium]|nr:response regulator [Blastocatellia bacterium]